MTESESRPVAFVLTPFEPEFDRIFERIIKPSIEEEGYEVLKANTNLQQRNIMRTIVEGVAHADLIVAELTGNNPNVFYELGMAHGLQQPVIMVSQDLSQVPFDLRSYNVLTYSTDVFEVDDFRASLRGLARGKIDGTVDFENPVSDFAPTGIQPVAAPPGNRPSPSVARGPIAEVEEHGEAEERGVLDFTSGAETAMEEIAGIAENFTQHMNDLGINMAARSAEVDLVNQSSTPGSAARMLRLANEMAGDLNRFSDDVATDLPAFHEAWERFENNLTNALPSLKLSSEEDREAAEGLLTIFDELREAMNQALQGIEQGRGQFEPLRGISARLNSAVRRLERTLDNLYEEFSTGESIVIRTRSLLEQKLQSE